jgi:hypothetical protein
MGLAVEGEFVYRCLYAKEASSFFVVYRSCGDVP